MRRVVLCAVLASAVACGSDDGPGSSVELCSVYQTVCERQAECGVYILSTRTDVGECMAELDCDGVAADAAENGIRIDSEAAGDCAAELSSATCEQLLPWVDGLQSGLFTVSDSCRGILVGTRGEGESCVQSAECAPGFACGGETCPGMCVADGSDSCDFGGCGPDQACAPSGCVARRSEGEVCEPSERDNSCVDGFYCSWTSLENDPVCKAQKATGAACDESNSFVCSGGQICDGQRCVDPTPLGSDCSVFDECGLTAYCDFDGGNVCREPKVLGATCSGSLFGECGDLQCIDNVCASIGNASPTAREFRAFVGEGEDCSDANCGANLVCWPNEDASERRCRKRFALGESCMPDTDIARLDVLFSLSSVSSCADSVCDIFADIWTCVDPAGPGESCDSTGPTLGCTSLFCDGNRCSEVFPDDCPF